MSDYKFAHLPMKTCKLRTAGLSSSKSAKFGMVRTNKDGTPRAHQGVDLACDSGYRCYAVDDGKIVAVQRGADGYGYTVTLKLNNGLFIFYAHLSEFRVSVGQLVEAGAVIGLTGFTGNAAGMVDEKHGGHLHLEVRERAVCGLGLAGRRNPLDYFDLTE